MIKVYVVTYFDVMDGVQRTPSIHTSKADANKQKRDWQRMGKEIADGDPGEEPQVDVWEYNLQAVSSYDLIQAISKLTGIGR